MGKWQFLFQGLESDKKPKTVFKIQPQIEMSSYFYL